MNKRKLYATRAAKLSCFMLALVLTLGVLQDFLLRRLDQNGLRLQGFYMEDKDSLDVVFLGASEVYSGFSSGLAYEKFGFTSYPYASQSITADGMLLGLKEILRTQKPQLIVVEINSFLYGSDENESNEAYIRKLVDNVPLTKNKIDYISDKVSPELQPEYYLPLIKYHDTWIDLPNSMMHAASKLQQDLRGRSILKGFRTTTQIFEPDEKPIDVKDDAETMKLNPVLEKKYRAFLSFCRDKKLNVLLLRMPHIVYKNTHNRARRCNRAAEIGKEYGYELVNLERGMTQADIDINSDFYNFDHLNVYGARKVTDHLGRLLTEKYGVRGRELTSEQKQHWDTTANYCQRLFRYCDFLIKNNEGIQVEENINTISKLEEYYR